MTKSNDNSTSQDGIPSAAVPHPLRVVNDDEDEEPPLLVDLEEAIPLPPLTTTTSTTTTTTTNTPTISLPPCPVTILSGFLGSGKTTLIQYILKSPNHKKRIAVIENEFGQGLDVESLIARDGVNDSDNENSNKSSLQDLIELPNGCICCTVKDSLIVTLEQLLHKRQDLDYILIEASGMANPGPIASVFWLDEALESRLQLDGIVTIVDAYHILHHLQSTEEAAQQIAYADRLLVNKMDLLQPQQDEKSYHTQQQQLQPSLDQVVQTLRSLHPTAPIKTTTYSQIPDLDWILNANCFGGISRLEELDTIWNRAREQEQELDPQLETGKDHHHHNHSHDHDHDGGLVCPHCEPSSSTGSLVSPQHKHTASISTLALQQPGSVDWKKFNSWLADLLWPNQDETNQVLTAILNDPSQKEKLLQEQQTMQIFRLKGIISVQHYDMYDDQVCLQKSSSVTTDNGLDPRRFIVQAVHDLWEVHPASDDLQWSPTEERKAKLVVIGKYLDKELLTSGFLSCFVPME